MNKSIWRSGYYLSNRLRYAAQHHKKQLLLGNRKVKLHPFNIETKSIFIHIPKTAGFSVAQAIYGMDPWHFRFRDYQQISGAEDLFTFSIVREPAMRLSSIYRFLRRNRAVAPQMADCRIAPDFRSFLEEFIYQMKAPAHPFLYGQLDYLVDENDAIAVDFVARMENLAVDFEYIKQRTDRTSVTLPHLNMSPGEIEISADDLQFIRATFQEEYERLGYA